MKPRNFLFLLTAILIVGGCAGLDRKGKDTNPTLLEPQVSLKFSDIPVPAGFKQLSQASYSFESSGMRVGLLKYEGKAQVDQIVNFYKEQMVMYNWNLLNIVEYGERLMNFDRETETCIITLIPRGNNTIITISLGPKAQQLPKKPQKPVK